MCTSGNPARPNGVCSEKDYAWGFYNPDLSEFILQGALFGYVEYSGQKFEMPMGGTYSHAIVTVYTEKVADGDFYGIEKERWANIKQFRYIEKI